MSVELRRRLRNGFSANLYGQAVSILIQLAGVPILLYAWGVEMYGEWLILFAIPAYLSMTDLGFSQSAANDMTARASRGDMAGMLCVFQSLACLVYGTVACGFVIISLLVNGFHFNDWLNFTQLTASDTRWILWLLAAEILVKLTDGINHAGFRASGKYAFHILVYYSTLLGQHASIWLIALLGYGPVAAAAGFFVLRFVVTPTVTWFLLVHHPDLKLGFRYASLATLKTLVRPAIANVAMPLAQAINIQGMILVVGAILGPPAVVVFSTLRTLTRLTLQMVLSVNNALEPELARAWGAADLSLIQRLYIQGFALSFWLASGSILALYMLGPWVFAIWTGGRVQMNHALFFWLMLSAFASVLWYCGLITLKAANRHLRVAVWFVISALAALLFATVLLNASEHLSDAGLALIAMDALMGLYVLILAGRFTGVRLSRLFLAVVTFPQLLITILGRGRHVN